MSNQEEHPNENPLMNIIQPNIEEEKDKNIPNNKMKQNINPIHQYFNPMQNIPSLNNNQNKNQKIEDVNYDELITGITKLNFEDASKPKPSSQKKPEQNNFFQNPMVNNNSKNNQKEMGAFNYFFGVGAQGSDLSKKMGENPSFLGQLGIDMNNNDENDENGEENDEEEKEENSNFKNNYKFGKNNNFNSQEKFMMMRNASNNNNFQNNNKMMMQMNNNNNNNMNNNMNINMNNMNLNNNNGNNNYQYNNLDPRIRNIIQQNMMQGNNQNSINNINNNNQNNPQMMMNNNFQRSQNNNKNRKKKNRGNKINNNNNVNIQNMNLIMNQQQLPYNYQYMQNQNIPYMQNQSHPSMQTYPQPGIPKYPTPQNQIIFPSGEGYPPVNMIGMNMTQNNNSITLDQFIARANTAFPGKFYVIKSLDESNIVSSIRFKIWCSTIKGNQKLQKAYKEADKKYPIFLFFSVNGSGKFMGIALMNSDVEYKVNFNYWSQNDKWKGFFMVDWICIKDVPNRMFRSIINDLNENKPVTSSRDTQEICTNAGVKMLKVFRDYPQESSIFDSQNDIKYQMNQRDYGRNNINNNINNNLNMNMNMKNRGGNMNNMNNMKEI